MALNISIKRWQGTGQSSFRSKTQEILGGVIPFTKVIIDDPGYRKFLKPSNTSDFYIVLWGYHASNQIISKVEATTAWGINIPWKEDIVLPSGKGREIVTPEGLVIAEFIDPNILAIFCNLSGIGSENDLKIYEEILYGVAEIYGYSKEVLLNMRNNKSSVDATNFLAAICENRLQGEKSKLIKLKKSIELSKEGYYKLLKEEKEVTNMLSSLETTMRSDMDKVKKEIESCVKMRHIKKVSVKKDNIVMTTDMIYIYQDNLKYKIGEFEIYINPVDGNVKFLNITPGHKRHSVWGDFCHHPHMNLEGGACWGNISTSVMSLIHDNEYEALTSVLVSYLESVNINDSAGKCITWWDVVDEDDNIIRYGLSPDDARKVVCSHCGERHDPSSTIRCADCGEIICASCIETINIDSGRRRVCKTCFESNYKKCNHCNVYLPKGSEYDLCYDCRHKHCISCNFTFQITELTNVNGELYCHDCHEKTFVKCDFCDNESHEDESLFCERCGKNTCEACAGSDDFGHNICPECRGGN